jgi:hypothetical protein
VKEYFIRNEDKKVTCRSEFGSASIQKGVIGNLDLVKHRQLLLV